MKCGKSKRRAFEQCKSCGFIPTESTDKAKSYMLSTGYQIAEDYRAKSWKALLAIGQQISRGEPYRFSDAEVKEVADYIQSVESITRKSLTRDVVLWLAGPALIVVVLLLLLLAT